MKKCSSSTSKQEQALPNLVNCVMEIYLQKTAISCWQQSVIFFISMKAINVMFMGSQVHFDYNLCYIECKNQ